MNWDDLRIVAAVRDEGTYAGASARLRIDETTVGRRLARIERALGLRPLEAVDGVRKPTRHCETELTPIQAMATHVAASGSVRHRRRRVSRRGGEAAAASGGAGPGCVSGLPCAWRPARRRGRCARRRRGSGGGSPGAGWRPARWARVGGRVVLGVCWAGGAGGA